MGKKIDGGKNPYDVYSSRVIDEYIEIYSKKFLKMNLKKICKEDSIIKKDAEIRVDHLHKVEIDGEIHILNIEDQLIYNKDIDSRQLLYQGFIDSKLNKNTDYPIISIFVIFLPGKNFKKKLRETNYIDTETKNIYRKDRLIITSINGIDPKSILEEGLYQFIPFIPFMREIKDKDENKSFYTKVFHHIKNISNKEEKKHINKFFLLFFGRKNGNLDLIEEISNMTIEELIKDSYLEEITNYSKEKWIKEGKEKGLKEGKEKGLKEGKEKGLKEGKIEIAKIMKNDGVDIDTIAKYSGLSKEKITKL